MIAKNCVGSYKITRLDLLQINREQTKVTCAEKGNGDAIGSSVPGGRDVDKKRRVLLIMHQPCKKSINQRCYPL